MKKGLSIGFILLFLVSCVTALPKKSLEGNTFLSHAPLMEVRFKKSVLEMKPIGHDYVFFFHNELPVRINFNRITHTNIDYYYSLEWIAGNVGYDYLGSIHVAGKKWAKFASLNKTGYLLTGYFTRKDKDFIEIYNFRRLDAAQQEKYQRRREAKKGDPGFLKNRFRKLNRTLDIVR